MYSALTFSSIPTTDGGISKVGWTILFQGGPHNHIIAAVATALKEANTEEFREYQRQVIFMWSDELLTLLVTDFSLC